MPKVQLFDKNEALLKAMNVFWAKGYKGTSLEDLTKGLDIGKGSFYNTFKSKKTLFENCINIYKTNSIDSLKEILSAEKNVKKGLRNFLIMNLEYAINDPQDRGCFLTNTCVEFAANDIEINQLMNVHYKLMKDLIKDYLSNGSDLAKEEIDDITNTIITFFIGMTVEVKLNNNQKEIESSINSLIEFLF